MALGTPPPLGGKNDHYNRVEPLRGISDIPRFVKDVCKGFFSRLGYSFKMVWNTGHWILFAMLTLTTLIGVLPIIGSLLSREILNELQNIISERLVADTLGTSYTAVFWGSMVMFLLIFFQRHILVESSTIKFTTQWRG